MMDDDLASTLGLLGMRNPLQLQWTDNSTQLDNTSMRVTVDIQGSHETCKHTIINVRRVKNLNLPLQWVNFQKFKQRWTHLAYVDLTELLNARPSVSLVKTTAI